MKLTASFSQLFSRHGLGFFLAGAALCFSGSAHALFEDGEARRAILDLRSKVEELQRADQGKSQEIQQLRSSLLDFQTQITNLRSDIASLRGENELLGQQLHNATSQLQQFVPAPVEVDGVTFEAKPAEQQAYDAALGFLRNGQFEQSRDAFSSFLAEYPQSGYVPSAHFWLGNSLYATRQYQQAINNFNALLKQSPQHPRAPEAALSIANSQLELKNVSGARKTLQDLVKVYPESDAAAAAKERLARLR